MRIKHFAGYGSVNAKKLHEHTLDGTHFVLVCVSGNHEWGLTRSFYDPWTIERWLGRFAKGEKLVDYEVVDHEYIRIDGCDTEQCAYLLAFEKEV